MSKRSIFFVLVLLISVLIITACQSDVSPAEEPVAEESAVEETATLAVSEWGYNADGAEEVWVKPLEEMYNVEIIFETGNNADRLSKLESMGSASEIDVIHLTENFALRAIELGLLQKLDMSRLENVDELYEWAKNPDGEGYCIASSINSYPILYRTDKVDPPPTSWKDLLREDLKGHVSMTDITSTFGPAQVVMMSLAHGGEVDNYELGWEKLPLWVDNTYAVAGYELVSLVQEGEIWMTPYGSYMIGALSEIDLPLELGVILDEGVPAARNVLCIVAGTDQEELAYAYINHVTAEESQTAMGMGLIESPVHKAVSLPDDIGSFLTYGEEYIDALIFPDFPVINPLTEEWFDLWNEIVVE